MKNSKTIAIVGGGISGVSSALRLAKAGFTVTVFESGKLGSCATSRNQGWLHSGAYFARTNAELSRTCYAAMLETISYCPESIEPNTGGMIYAATDGKSKSEEWLQAWEQAGIPHQQLLDGEANWCLPLLDKKQLKWKFRLPDRAFNSAILLSKMIEDAVSAGVTFRENCCVTSLHLEKGAAVGVVIGNQDCQHADHVIIASGSESLRTNSDLFAVPAGRQQSFELVNLKAHLYGIRPGLPGDPFCIVDGMGLNHVPHQHMSVFGNNRWNYQPGKIDSSQDDEEVQLLKQAINKLYPNNFGLPVESESWAGVNLQVMRDDQVIPGVDPMPTVIDHAVLPNAIQNLVSIFPGRATMWGPVAEEVCVLLKAKLTNDSTTTSGMSQN